MSKMNAQKGYSVLDLFVMFSILICSLKLGEYGYSRFGGLGAIFGAIVGAILGYPIGNIPFAILMYFDKKKDRSN